MAVTNPVTPDPRRFPIRLPRPLWIGLAAVVLSLNAAGAGDPAENESGDNAALPEQQFKIADPTVFGWVFGDGSDADAARKQLDTLLPQKIAIVDRVCGLTDTQKQTLQLAGRGDNKRLLDRVEEMGMQLQLVKNDENKVQALFQNAKTLKHHVGPGLFHDTLFVKSLEKTLAAEQPGPAHQNRAVCRTVRR
jgi:hypothetical protein